MIILQFMFFAKPKITGVLVELWRFRWWNCGDFIGGIVAIFAHKLATLIIIKTKNIRVISPHPSHQPYFNCIL